MKKIIIIAGPNGAGKTTFAREFLPNEAECPQFINADLIAAGLSPFAPEVAALRAARIMLDSMAELERRDDSFAFETTLSGLAYARRVRLWREAGYHVTLFFLSLPSPQMAIDRVAERVRQGGHDVPSDVIRRRFIAGLRNFERVYRDAVDAWAIYDNSGDDQLGRKAMNQKKIEFAKDPDLAGSWVAIRRAAKRAAQVAESTNTELVVQRNGKCVHVKPGGQSKAR